MTCPAEALSQKRAPKFSMRTGEAMTVMEALEVFPVPPCVAEICAELFFTPTVVPVTLSETVQDADVASDEARS